MKPPYTITPGIFNLCTQIERLLGRYEGLKVTKPQPQLRRKNRIRSIQSSLSIEGNVLSCEQVSDILDQKRVMGPKKDILEVQNAIRTYDRVSLYKVLSEKSFLETHASLMKALILDAGKWRTTAMTVREGDRIIHMAPKAHLVPQLMTQLFEYMKSEKTTNPLILSSVFHYEVEFIHPFSDGNGRMGRLWQHVFLVKHHPLYEFLPIESMVRKYQKDYYDSLHQSDTEGNSTSFIEFCLKTILESMEDFLEEVQPEPLTPESRLELAKEHFKKQTFSRKDYRHFFKTLSTATASRDLQYGVEKEILTRTGEKALATYLFG